MGLGMLGRLLRPCTCETYLWKSIMLQYISTGATFRLGSFHKGHSKISGEGLQVSNVTHIVSKSARILGNMLCPHIEILMLFADNL